MKTFLFFLTAITITNGIFVFLIHNAMKEQEEVINRQGTIISFMLVTPEIKSSLDRQLQKDFPTATTTPQ